MKVLYTFLLFSLLTSLTSCEREYLEEDFINPNGSSSNTEFHIAVTSHNPDIGETNVSINSTIQVIFNDNIDPLTINSDNFYINNGTVNGTHLYNETTRTATFTPVTPLSLNTTYEITLTTGITNVAGETLKTPVIWSFTTSPINQPEITVYETTYPLITGENLDIGNEVIAGGKPVFFTIANNGVNDLIINSITLNGLNADQYIVNAPTLLPITPGNTFGFSIDFAPNSTGIKYAQIVIDNNDASEPLFSINLKGTAVATPSPYFMLKKDTHTIIIDEVFNLGTVLIGTSSPITSFTILNKGTADLNINSINLSGTDAALFNMDIGGVVTPVAPNTSTNFNISFAPLEYGSKTAHIAIDNDDPGLPLFNFSVSGRGN